MYSPATLLNPTADNGASIGAPLLYIVRHAQNDDDRDNKIRGLKDQPINQAGERQLQDLREFFEARPVLSVVADDLSRSRATALAIAQSCGCSVETDIGLRSWDLGKLEGKSMSAHKLEIADFKTHPDKVPTAGQSWGDFKRIACDTLSRWVRKAMESSAPIALVTHGSFIQIAFEEYGGWDENADYDHTPLDQAGVAGLYLTRNGMNLKGLKDVKESLDE